MKKTVVTCALAAILALGPLGGAGWAAPRQGAAPAATAAPRAAYPVGEVVSDAPLHVRERATVYSAVLKSLRPGQRVLLNCQARGGWVDGNPVWYRLQGSRGWVSARFVHNHQPVRAC
ncbi:SH3 domain-containing protein [Streptomyces sp. NRRL F-2664]|uniref:SH3 domain-containing protein n=1 Tax=Streptomyces sp. NRRL F-2664 TaxID=1463842 RepID=UPI0006903908|nr:SH3 domain-containing protein [Streptomyces sp. NRRL F-2664]